MRDMKRVMQHVRKTITYSDRLFEGWWKRERSKWADIEVYKPLAKAAWNACSCVTDQSSEVCTHQEQMEYHGFVCCKCGALTAPIVSQR